MYLETKQDLNRVTQRIFMSVGDPHQIDDRGGSTYFFLKFGKELGFLDRGLPLQPQQLKTQRLLWNFFSFLRTGQIGGFQYSPMFLTNLFSQVQLEQEAIEFISRFPLLPPTPWKKTWQVSYHIDATLKQNFEFYNLTAFVSHKARKSALEQEKINYTNAKYIICMSQWAANSVIEDYDISPKKVHIIGGGANLDETHPSITKPILVNGQQYADLQPLRLGFIGKDWQRKGLLPLIQTAEILEKRGIKVEIVTVGPSASQLPPHPLVHSAGFISKFHDMERFIALIRSFHFGCLFSSAEAYGISNLECLRLGVPVIATQVGGIPDTVPTDLGFLLELQNLPQTAADLLETFVRNPAKYQELRKKVSIYAEHFSWQHTVKKFIQLWQGSQDFCYANSKSA